MKKTVLFLFFVNFISIHAQMGTTVFSSFINLGMYEAVEEISGSKPSITVTTELTGEAGQSWIFKLLEDGTYSIINTYTGNCLTVDELLKKDGRQIIASKFKGGNHQKFIITSAESKIPYGFRLINCKYGDALTLTCNGEIVLSCEDVNNKYQLWAAGFRKKIEEFDSGMFISLKQANKDKTINHVITAPVAHDWDILANPAKSGVYFLADSNTRKLLSVDKNELKLNEIDNIADCMFTIEYNPGKKAYKILTLSGKNIVMTGDETPGIIKAKPGKEQFYKFI